MRIDQASMSANVASVATTPVKASAARTDSTVTVQQADKTKTYREVQDLSAVQKMEHFQQEAEIMTDENSEDQEHKVIKAIEKANKHIKTYDRRLEFSIHEQTKQIMVKVIDTEDDSTIREIPSEKVLDMVAHLWEMAGILIDEKR